jgi:hypothetical protein
MLARCIAELELLQTGIQRVELSVSKHFDNVKGNRIYMFGLPDGAAGVALNRVGIGLGLRDLLSGRCVERTGNKCARTSDLSLRAHCLDVRRERGFL